MSGGSSLKLLDTSQLKDRIQTHEHKLGARKKKHWSGQANVQWRCLAETIKEKLQVHEPP